MRLTNPDSLPVPEPGDDVDPLEDWFGDLADAVQKALRRDTGWINVTIADATKVVANASEPPQVRVVNGILYFRGQFDGRGGAAVAAGTWGTIPVAMAPVGQRLIAKVYQGNATVLGRLIVGTNGSLAFNPEGATVTYFRLDMINPTPVAAAVSA